MSEFFVSLFISAMFPFFSCVNDMFSQFSDSFLFSPDAQRVFSPGCGEA